MPFVLTWFPSHRAAAARRSTPSRRSTTREEYWLDWAGRCRPPRRLPRGDPPVAARAEGAHVRADRRDRRGADDVAAGADRRRAQLGLPLLLAARRDADAARDAERRLPRRGDGVAPVAPARRRRRPGRRPDHVRDRRRAAARRARARLAAGLRGVDDRCGSATPRREQLQLDVYGEVHRRALPDARPRRAGRRQRLVADAEAARLARGRLAARGRRHLGGARAEPALHPLEGDGLGRVRPRRPLPRGVRPRGAGRALAGALRDEIHAEVLARAWSDGEAGVRAVLRLRRARRERPADAARRVPARRPTSASSRRSRRSGAS